MKRIEFNEYTYVLNEYPSSIEITEEDNELFTNNEISLEELIEKYDIEVDGCSEVIYEDTIFDSYKLV